MLTKVSIKNFKRLEDAIIELGNPVIFIGPNNSGKTSALQALALWDIGLKRWSEKRKGAKIPEKRSGVTINRRDLVSIPIPHAILLWKDRHVKNVHKESGKTVRTDDVYLDITVEGVTEGTVWKCGLEFYYANEESFYCRPIRLSETENPGRMAIPDAIEKVNLAYLPPMSGLVANETRLDPGAINVRIGEGRTAEVLRNLCYKINENNPELWDGLQKQIDSLFHAKLEAPKYIRERGEIEMSYIEHDIHLDISSSGRGLQQTLLLLAYMYSNPGVVLLLDEPDAHLEILRQREIYQLLTDVARENKNQIIAASHSEVLLNEAADRDVVVAFVGKPHRIDDRGSQVRKALKDIGFDQYYQAEESGWILYLEGSTDLAILRAFANTLEHHDAIAALARPFVHYVGNKPNEVRKHFHGLREAVPELVGIAVFDRLDQGLPSDLGAEAMTWARKEIENYLCYPETLEAYAKSSAFQDAPGPLFTPAIANHRNDAMQESIQEVEQALKTLSKSSPWDENSKVSDDFLMPLFEKYFNKLNLPNIMAKKNFHELALFVPKEMIDPEIREKLDTVVRVAKSAKPRTNK